MMLLPHRHVVMTIPHALAPMVKSNGKELLNILLRTAADTFKDWVLCYIYISPDNRIIKSTT